MSEAIAQAYESAKGRLGGMSLEQFKVATLGLEVHAVNVRGRCVGALIVNGPEIHACVNGHKGEWLQRQHIRVLNAVIERHGYAVTSATTDDGEAFVRRLGFSRVGDKWKKEQPYGH